VNGEWGVAKRGYFDRLRSAQNDEVCDATGFIVINFMFLKYSGG